MTANQLMFLNAVLVALVLGAAVFYWLVFV